MKRIALALVTLAAIGSSTFAMARSPQDGPKPKPWMYDNEEGGTYTTEWDGRPDPDRGACFYTDPHFTGHHFCITAGQRVGSLPKGFGDKITSIRIFGGGEATVYGKRKFEGKHVTLGTEEDLGDTRGGGHKSWNDRISSISVH